MSIKQEVEHILKDSNIMLLESDDCFIVFKGKRQKQVKKIKKISKAWLLDKIDKLFDTENKNLRLFFQDNLKIEGNIYFTSFGFSYDMFFKSQKQFDIDISAIKQVLDNKNIKYRCEYSDANWVYRFIISKETNNLAKINKL